MNDLIMESKRGLTSPLLLIGGTFDPIHYGHLQSALEVAEFIGADEIRLIPNRQPPHRNRPQTPEGARLDMCRLAAQLDTRFVVDERELKRDDCSYTVDSLIELSKDELDRPICFSMGIDAFLNFDKWHRWQELLKHAHIIVMSRPGYEAEFNSSLSAYIKQHETHNLDDIKGKLNGHIYFVATSELMISSTTIRQRLANDLNCRCLMPNKVYDYILDNDLYK